MRLRRTRSCEPPLWVSWTAWQRSKKGGVFDGQSISRTPRAERRAKRGVIWIRDFNLYGKLSGTRSIVRIVADKRRIYSEALHADDRHLERWRDNLADRIEKTLGRSIADLEDRRAELQKSLEKSKSVDPLVFMSKWHRVRLGLCPDGAPCTAMLSIRVGEWPRTLLWQFRAGI